MIDDDEKDDEITHHGTRNITYNQYCLFKVRPVRQPPSSSRAEMMTISRSRRSISLLLSCHKFDFFLLETLTLPSLSCRRAAQSKM